VNSNDLVTRVPPRSFGYRHLGTFKYFTEDGAFAEDIGWWDRFLDGWRIRIEDIVSCWTDGIRDHSMTGYRQRVGYTLESLRNTMPANFQGNLDHFLRTFFEGSASMPVVPDRRSRGQRQAA
jgi:hypothetical protein